MVQLEEWYGAITKAELLCDLLFRSEEYRVEKARLKLEAYYKRIVFVAPSGNGAVHHEVNCHKICASRGITMRRAVNLGYHRCTSCGGG
tara:strand:- start:2934 stop:3200 length:267 start_codon:yes stop_codon:yes gene_type:complete